MLLYMLPLSLSMASILAVGPHAFTTPRAFYACFLHAPGPHPRMLQPFLWPFIRMTALGVELFWADSAKRYMHGKVPKNHSKTPTKME